MKIIAIIFHVLCCAVLCLYVCPPFYLSYDCMQLHHHNFSSHSPTKLLSLHGIQFVHFYSNSCYLFSDFLFAIQNCTREFKCLSFLSSLVLRQQQKRATKTKRKWQPWPGLACDFVKFWNECARNNRELTNNDRFIIPFFIVILCRFLFHPND